jgi:hypothetical protein
MSQCGQRASFNLAVGTLDLLGLLDDPAFLGPLPKRSKFWWRSISKLFAMLRQHLSERHTVGAGAIRIGSAFQQVQCIRVLAYSLRAFGFPPASSMARRPASGPWTDSARANDSL